MSHYGLQMYCVLARRLTQYVYGCFGDSPESELVITP